MRKRSEPVDALGWEMGGPQRSVSRLRLAFVVDGRAVPKGRPRLGKHGHVYTPRTTELYEEKIRLFALRAMRLSGWSTTSQPCSIVLHFFQDTARRVDVDNLAKSVMDGLMPLVVRDDSQFVMQHVEKHMDAARPRVEITIERLESR